MSANPFSRLGYLAIGEETTAGTPVKPSVYAELISEDVVAQYGRQPVTGISGKRDAKLRSVHDKITVEGSITFCVEPNTVGHFLQMVLGAPTTSTIASGKVYQHVFEPATTLKSYTMDIKKAGETHVRRVFGAYVDQVEINQQDNKIMCTVAIKALGIFDHARLTSDEPIGSTGYDVDQTKGLTTSDILEVRSKTAQTANIMTHSVVSASLETSVLVDSKGVAATAGDLLFIQSSTPTYKLSDNLIWIGGSTYGVRAEDDNYNAIDNITEVDAEDWGVTIANTLEERHTARGVNLADRFPAAIWAKDFTAEGNFSHYYSTPEFIDDMRQKGKVATRIRHYGRTIDTNSAVSATLTIGTEPGAVVVTADTAGESGNDFNVTITTNSSDTLQAEKTGNNILVKLANATAGNNRADDVAGVIDALSGLSATGVSGTVSVAILGKTNLTGGRDANEKDQLRVDFPNTLYRPFADNLSEEDLINEEIEYDAYFDETESVTARVVLRNGITSY